MPRTARLLSTAAAGCLLLAGVAAPAAARHSPPEPETFAEGLVSPLSLAVTSDGTSYVTQSNAGVLTKVDKRGKRSDIYAAEGAEIAGVSVGSGKVTFAENRTPSPEPGAEPDPNAPPPTALIQQMDRKGKVRTLADLWAFEETNNPDAKVTYGVVDLPASCVVPPELGPSTYTGIVESHPYATATLPGGDVIVADAAANAILKVSAHGKDPKVLAVLPPVEAVIPPEAVEMGVPECAVGLTYLAEPVPTDVELGHDGQLYVTSLPGFPGEQGAYGSVWRINPWTGKQRQVASGFMGATNLAVAPWGDIYVSELFGGKVSVLPRGSSTARTFLEIDGPASVEWQRGKLYLTTYDLTSEEGTGALLKVKASFPVRR
ncbi:ScyD/ScyE family protein [Georgenia yuyongxinii]|uniref:ScyD/ScyE family protein n=1 Tax=Georgenia yuyongxinii TaxID=2589797 RepID=A0A5B8BZP2_9MICO|nr:ScyD/ScyE family protein [Georgenia yuyongxinii]QDC23277.1 ScyD/ScyE family protein [Georgenia yuyongxinii]